MRNFLLGLIVGFIIGGTGVYKIVMDKINNVATKENAEKFVNASKQFGGDVAEIFEEN